MKLDELLRQEVMQKLHNRGVPEFFTSSIEEEYKGYSGKRLHTIFDDIEVYKYNSMVQWFEEVPNHWELAAGFEDCGVITANVYDMSTLYPAAVLSGDIYLYIPDFPE